MFEFEVTSRLAAAPCAPHIVSTIEKHAKALGEGVMRLPSGAAHDAQTLSPVCPVGMIFVPSHQGRSHSASEWTSWEAIEAGANVLLRTLVDLAQR